MGLTFVGLAPRQVNEFDGIICMQSFQNDAERSIYHRFWILWSDLQACFLKICVHTLRVRSEPSTAH